MLIWFEFQHFTSMFHRLAVLSAEANVVNHEYASMTILQLDTLQHLLRSLQTENHTCP
jgi:hypothetical protein